MLDISSGRVVNPGHDIEYSCWDNEFGGLLSFIDCKGYPPEAYEHDMKLWWPHNEMMIASLMFYKKNR